jgi:hypothetical protein
MQKILSVCCFFIGCLVTASNAADSSASVCTSLLAGDFLTTNSVLLLNVLHQWGILHFPRLHQKWPSATTSDGSASQLITADSLLSQDWLACVSILQISLRTDPPEHTFFFAVAILHSHAATGACGTENTASDSSSTIACITVATLT